VGLERQAQTVGVVSHIRVVSDAARPTALNRETGELRRARLACCRPEVLFPHCVTRRLPKVTL
jgi:hypothetical protein